ncbi:MAG: hypothetical protein LUD74_02735, partial [Tannerellaceae bacterium]|nr:hypothetical protein [Tannerellaceae bacterium]
VYDNVVVRSSEWKLVTDDDGSNPHFICEKYFDELDNYILQYGSTETYMYLDPNNINGGLVSLTDSYPIEDGILGPTWTEFYSAIYFPGSIVFTVRYSDFAEDIVPPTTKFKVIFTWD